MQLWAVAELFVIQTSSIFARVHLDLVSLWALTRLTHQVAASQRKHCCVKTDRRKARRQRVGGSRACGWAPCLDAWAAHSAQRTAHCSEERGWVGGERVRAAAGGLCELSVWLLIIQNGCKVETVLFLCGPYHSPRRRIWPDSVPTQRGRRRARALPRIAVHVNLASARSVMYCTLWKPWTWALGTRTKKNLIFFFPKLLK